jgi:tetratricopeptide (TPR) repeat protein
MFGLFRQSIRLKILLEDDILQEGIFKNIITISLVVGEYEWAEQFIQEYAGYLPSDIRENARTFNLANLYFFQKKYDRVIELLQNVEYSDVVYALSAKFVLVRTYYETEEFMALDSLIDSFRIFLRRNKLISKTFKTEYNNFLLFVKKLSILPPGNPKAVAQLRGQIERCNAVVTKKWLLEKIDAF